MGTHPIFESDFDCLTDFGLVKKCQLHQNKWCKFMVAKRPRPPLPTVEPVKGSSRSTENHSNKSNQKHFSLNFKNQLWSLEKNDLLESIFEFVCQVVVVSLKFMPFVRQSLELLSLITRNMSMNNRNKKLRICRSRTTEHFSFPIHAERNRKSLVVQVPEHDTKNHTDKNASCFVQIFLHFIGMK